MATPVVFPVRYVSGDQALQTTSRELSPQGIAVRALQPPKVGSRVSMALYLPEMTVPEVAIGRVARANSRTPAEAGFWADFILVDPAARRHIGDLLAARVRQSPPDHRTFSRHPVQLNVRLRTALEFVHEHAVNLSRGGVFVRSDDPPALDTPVEVELELPDGGEVARSKGIVVHRVLPGGAKEAGAGVQFVDGSDAFRVRVDRYLATLLKS